MTADVDTLEHSVYLSDTTFEYLTNRAISHESACLEHDLKDFALTCANIQEVIFFIDANVCLSAK